MSAVLFLLAVAALNVTLTGAALASTGPIGTPELDLTTVGSMMAAIGSSYYIFKTMRKSKAK